MFRQLHLQALPSCAPLQGLWGCDNHPVVIPTQKNKPFEVKVLAVAQYIDCYSFSHSLKSYNCYQKFWNQKMPHLAENSMHRQRITGCSIFWITQLITLLMIDQWSVAVQVSEQTPAFKEGLTNAPVGDIKARRFGYQYGLHIVTIVLEEL
jgi:hypothetical protein